LCRYGVAWTATEAPAPEELMEALKGPQPKRTVPPIGVILVGGGGGGAAAATIEEDDAELVVAESVTDGGGKKGGKKGSEKGAKGAKESSGQEPRKAAKKLKAVVKAARKPKGLGPIAKAAGVVKRGSAGAGGGGGGGTGAATAGVQRRAPPPLASMDKLRSAVLTDWRLQAATVEVVAGPAGGGSKVALAPLKGAGGKGAAKGAGFTSRPDARGGRMSVGSQAAIV
jgi:hypothetical protein